MRVHGHSSCALHLGIPSCWSGNVFNLAVEHGQKGQITQLLKLEMSVVKAFMVSLFFFFFFLFLSYFSTWHCEIKFEMKVFMDVIVFQLLRFKTSLRSCWNYIPSFYVPSIFPRCFNVFWKVLNLKNSRASKVERFVKWIFFLRIYIISTFYTCSNYARLILHFLLYFNPRSERILKTIF